MGHALGLNNEQIKQFIDICQKLYRLFVDYDASSSSRSTRCS